MANRDGATEDSAGRDRVVVLNPKSGSATHADRIRRLADDRGLAVEETREEGDAVRLAREAAEGGATLVAAAGGDGTVNEVVRGLDEADALGSVTLAVVPAGTGNNFAKNIGVTGIKHAFELVEGGRTRDIDVGTADGRLFLNSCVGGITADASAETTPEMKSRFGVLAYVIGGLRTATEFDGLHLDVKAGPEHEGDSQWSGEALFVLVGNGRRFPAEGRTQANMEDGLLEVTIIERMPASDLLSEAAVQRLFGRETDRITHLKSSELEIRSRDDEPINFSLDGEMVEQRLLSLGVRPRLLSIRVGEQYEENPDV